MYFHPTKCFDLLFLFSFQAARINFGISIAFARLASTIKASIHLSFKKIIHETFPHQFRWQLCHICFLNYPTSFSFAHRLIDTSTPFDPY
jgi:hypothetical protein